MPSNESPAERLAAQANRCRATWRRLSPAKRAELCRRLEAEGHPVGRVWIAVLEGRHPLAEWLDGDLPLDALPDPLPGGSSARQLISFHPFTDTHPWLSLPMSRGSSSTPPA